MPGDVSSGRSVWVRRMTPAAQPIPDDAWVVALLTLPSLGPSRLHQLLARYGAKDSWERLRTGKPVSIESVRPSIIDGWREAARRLSVAEHWEAIHSLGIAVVSRHSSDYPRRLADDIEPPEILFSLGGLADVLRPDNPTVAIVGTRKCTAYGQRCAFELGAALAESGVTVISGLALGIDAAAHRGALSASGGLAAAPAGVVGSGLDVVYPKQNSDLWTQVARRGVLCSETPPGIGPASWRFPARNRIIAALADALIVVESHDRGGSLISVDEAQLRDVPVGVVPGPITSNASAGSNRLLVDGATPVLDVSDVLALIGYSPPRPAKTGSDVLEGSEVLDAMGWTPLSLEQICARIARPAPEIAAEVERLVATGVMHRNGPWLERVR